MQGDVAFNTGTDSMSDNIMSGEMNAKSVPDDVANLRLRPHV